MACKPALPIYLRIVLTAAFLCAATPARSAGKADVLTAPAYDRPWQLTSYAETAGLSHRRVFDIAFDKTGAVWLAADDGLRRYNGYSWQLFDTNSGLPSSFVRAVTITRSGEMWVGTDKGAGVFDPVRNRYETRGSENGLAGPNIRQIVEDPDGTLWFCCDQWPDISSGKGGLTSLRDGKWETYDTRRGLPLDYIIGYFRDSSGRQFAMTPRGWVQRRGENWGSPEHPGYKAEECVLHMTEGTGGVLFAQGERSLLRLKDNQWQVQDSGTVLVGSTTNGQVMAARLNSTRGTLRFELWNGEKFTPASGAVSCPPGARFYRLSQAPDGSIWAVGYGTVVKWAFQSGQWSFYPDMPPPSMLDRHGRLWFSGDSNVVMRQDGVLQRLSELRQVLSVNDEGVLGLQTGRNALVMARSDNPALMQPVRCGIETVVRSLVDAEGRLWVAGYDKDNTVMFARRDGQKWVTVSSPDLQNKRLGSMSVDPQRGLWAVLYPTQSMPYELVRVLDNHLEWQTFSASRPSLTYPHFFIGANQCWMQGYSGLYQKALDPASAWQPAGGLQESGVLQSAVGDNEVIVLLSGRPSRQSGCALYRDGKWTFQTGNFDRVEIGPDKKTVFLAGRDGVHIRREPGTLDLRYLPFPEELVVGNIVQDKDGSLWVGSSDGVFQYRPSPSQPDTRVSATLTEVRQRAGLPVTLRAYRRFSISDPPEAFRYSWRFDGGAWSRFGAAEQLLSLPPLSPGQHRLEVRSCDPDDNVDPTPAALDFAILDVPLQQRVWFQPLVGMVIALIVYLSWIGITRTRQIARSNTALRQEIAVRRQAEAELEQARAGLEKRVTERTAELSQANESLSREITEREQAQKTQHQLEEQLRQSQKMEAIGTLAGGIAHDFNNILAVIIPYTELALADVVRQPGVQEKLNRVLTAAERAKNLVQQILAFSRHQKQQRRPIALDPIIRETVKLLRPALPATIQIHLDLQGTPRVFADPTQIHQVLMNLCTNAEHAMRNRFGKLSLELCEVSVDEASVRVNPDLRPGRYVKLTVRDDGCGMKEEVQRRIFDPFFTTKQPGEGTGLGLAVVHGILRNHDGAITLHSRPGVGTEFHVYLPVYTGKPVRAKYGPRSATSSPVGEGEHILVVDDETAVCDVVGAVLTRVGYQVTQHTNPTDALDEFRGHPDKYDLVLTDLTMPGMTGIDLAKRLFEIRPGLPVLLTTGFGGSWEPKVVEELGIRKVIQKPADFNSLGHVVHEALYGDEK